MKKKSRRRAYPIIDRSLQYKFLFMILAYGLITIAILAIALFIPDIIAVNNEHLSLEMRGAAAQRILALHARVWPSVIAVVCLLGIHSFRVFLRIVGPLFRFRWAFSKIGKGDLNFRVKLRKKDQLRQEAKMFNEMMDIVAVKWGKMQVAGMDSLRSLDALEELVPKMGSIRGEYRQILESHRENLENLVEQARYFRLRAEKKADQEAGAPLPRLEK